MVEEGVLEGVDRIFGLHVYSILPFGTLGYRPGPLMAAGDFFDVKITGKGDTEVYRTLLSIRL